MTGAGRVSKDPGQSEGAKRERTRIAQLDAILTPETQEIVAKAKLEGKQALDVMTKCFTALRVGTKRENRAEAAALIINAALGRNECTDR